MNHVEYTLACTRFSFDNHKAYRATAYRWVRNYAWEWLLLPIAVVSPLCSIRDRLIESWNDTNQHFDTLDVKRVCVALPLPPSAPTSLLLLSFRLCPACAILCFTYCCAMVTPATRPAPSFPVGVQLSACVFLVCVCCAMLLQELPVSGVPHRPLHAERAAEHGPGGELQEGACVCVCVCLECASESWCVPVRWCVCVCYGSDGVCVCV